MYAHPSFVWGCPEVLSQLRKCANSKDKIQENKIIGTSDGSICSNETGKSQDSFMPTLPRIVTPLLGSGLNQEIKHQQSQANYNFPPSKPGPKSALSQPNHIMWQEPNVYYDKEFLPAINKIDPSNLDPIAQTGSNKLALLAIALKILGD
eukprot:CAMPEP_0197827134 /NCGR_PEP_ID=MMETSP1437-20131217/3989_1 /TAXON_ID=49252 ORGANISM="Eucampia antarctica, Strain CCMP1452" /NCGR_SAMPLE_ID=MMETSP1437 /ASSEMBLY_ACC=CAM_ASM_001096 /LENGTH=149 /DNA_ID=CAMNT_0043427871 /DNA_START=340 /DNA_END=789 /DNA_ORIENTATION=+